MDKKKLATESIDEFIDALIEMRGLVPLDKHLLHLLFEIKSDIPLHTQKFLTLCMSLLDDGNTRVPLDSQHFSAMWTRKWNGLVFHCLFNSFSACFHINNRMRCFFLFSCK